jgi:FixJ family two-component response regulator
MALEVLVVDDEEDIRDLVSGVLEDEGYAVRTAADSTCALDAIKDRRPSLVLLDVWLQGSRLDGLQLLQQIKRQDSTLPVLMISGHGNLDTAVAAVREGAVDFIEKPFEAGHLLHLVSRATETDRLRRENESLRQQIVHDEVLSGLPMMVIAWLDKPAEPLLSRISEGSMSASIRSTRSQGARMIVRSMMLRSWRTLPGQSCACRAATASSDSAGVGIRRSAAKRARK